MGKEINKYKPTQVDEGWRNDKKEKSATKVDEGWRKNAKKAGNETKVDEGWRHNASVDGLDASDIMNMAAANYFPTLEAFKEAVVKLHELVSSNNNVYKVEKTLSTAGGESVILLCSDSEGKKVVAKVYYESVNSPGSSVSSRRRVLEYMKTEEGQKYTLAVSEIGLQEFGNSKYYFEIMPFVEEGDISNKGAFSFDEICVVTRQLNEAIHSIHKFGILHRDITPNNIYKIADRYVLGDFGVATVTQNGNLNVTRHVVGKDGYVAPELRLCVTDQPTFTYGDKTDYYSLGVTLGSLFEGHNVYDGMEASMISVSVQKGKLPLRRLALNRELLENLLKGLCKYDAKYRFGYDDVNQWLSEHNYTGSNSDEEWPKKFNLLGVECCDEESLFKEITQDEEHWNEAKDLLYRKYFERFFNSFRLDLAREAQKAEETYRSGDSDKGLAVFLKKLYPYGPIVYRGYTFSNLQELGNKMVAAKKPAAYGEILRKHCISYWLDNTKGISIKPDTRNLIDEIERLAESEPQISCFWFGNSFAEKRQLTVCEKTVSTISQLVEALFASPAVFYKGDGLKKILSREEGADLYGFLFSFGYKKIWDDVMQKTNQCDLFGKTCFLLSMIDDIAVKENVDPVCIRKFFVKYGPIGIATYTKQLLTRANKIYKPLDAEGKRVISKIIDFREPTQKKIEKLSIDELYKIYDPLIQNVDKFNKILIDNPFCVSAGVYKENGVICTNLIGCFAFNIFGRQAPIGFSYFIEKAEGDTD